ncbi:hypothetical protein [Arthrobacter caoxuetaonis]|uniref:hypothetical protein n=1 Tax=Arthrobacter caoxuetaonis TaxID=2886935 RepID=UPI001D13E704|nr:hypothetical protein [Arthrobacter caoxuetaonis]MCC3282473.1 hypothetical protein [Arthrobacter caoxuetaonis]
MRLRAGATTEMSRDMLPGPAEHTVVWIDEVCSDGSSKPLTSRFRLDALKAVAKLERWLRDPLRIATEEEAEAMLETLAVWEHFADAKWKERLTRLVKDVNRRVAGARHIPPNSRIALFCRLDDRFGFSNSLPGNVVTGLTASLELHALLGKYGTPNVRRVEHLSRMTTMAISEPLRGELRTIVETSKAYNSSTTMSHLLRGQILSVIKGRAAAAEEFRTAISKDSKLIKSMYLDMGAFTYGVPRSDAKRNVLNVSWHGGVTLEDARVTVLYSANIAFLRRYFARIIFYALAEPNQQLHFHIVADEPEALDFIREATELANGMHTFSRRSSERPRISWSSSRLPEDVGNPVTYFACARYLVAQQIMDRFETDVWIQDVDLFPVSPVSDSPVGFAEFDVIVAASTGNNMLAPWRRYLAGNVFLSRSNNGRQFITQVENYIWTFLPVVDSWMLDQNALDWAIECAPAETAIGNMRVLGVGLTQSVMSGPIES